MNRIREKIKEWSDSKCIKYFNETQSGLNVAVDNTSDKFGATYCNVNETGSVEGRIRTRNLEIVFLKSVPESSDGCIYLHILDHLERCANSLYSFLIEDLDITGYTYETGVDQYDQNCCIYKITLSVDEPVDLCIDESKVSL